jgi:membrane-bound lytic murein transglycosylase A
VAFASRLLCALALACVVGGCTSYRVAPEPTGALPVAPLPSLPSPAPVATVKLEAVDYAILPGWTNDAQSQALPALLGSCAVLAKEARWQPFCAALKTNAQGSDAAIRHLVETYLTPYRVVAEGGSTTGLVTGYYEPVLRGSRTRHAPFLTPLYRVPGDLIDVDPAVTGDVAGPRLRGRLVGRTLVPYPTRAELASSRVLAGQELVWVEDPVEAFFMQIQGSGKVQIVDAPSPEMIRLAYADQNGQPYRSIGKWLIDQHELGASEASMQGIKGWVAAHPDRAEQLFNVNPRVVFFKEEKLPDPTVGPKGALGVPLTDGRSIAVDPKVVPLGSPVYLATSMPNANVPVQRLVSAADTGAAIVTAADAAVRVDLYFGSGAKAGEDAGRMKQSGQMWVLLPNRSP